MDISNQQAALGKTKAELVLKNGSVINVFSDSIIKADVAISNGMIIGVGEYDGLKEIDCTGKYISPGYIDAHMHIESTMVLPYELSKAVIARGTTTLIADPHELVNVRGAKALKFLFDAIKNLPVDIFVMAPSSVPATKSDTNGCGNFSAHDMKEFINEPRLIGLGEVMCYNDVLSCDEAIFDKLDMFRDKIIDGHAPGLSGKYLEAYRLAGISTDHECTTYEEAYEKLCAGFNILIREGSGARNLEAIVLRMLLNGTSFERCAFCTDDKHLEDIVSEGHIDLCIKKSVELGLDPITAVKTATYSAAKIYSLDNIGAVAAGYKADINILTGLDSFKPYMTLKNGEIVNDEYLERYNGIPACAELTDTVKTGLVTSESLKVLRGEKNHVIKILDNEIITEHLYEAVPGDKYFIPDGSYSKLCVIERHGKNGNISACAAKGYNIHNGAVASTVSHDSHNIVAIGDNDKDIICAVEALKSMRGGCVLVSGGKVIASVALPVAGLMSDAPASEVIHGVMRLRMEAYNLGVNANIDPLITLSFLALPVIPCIRLLDTGLFDVDNYEMIDKEEKAL